MQQLRINRRNEGLSFDQQVAGLVERAKNERKYPGDIDFRLRKTDDKTKLIEAFHRRIEEKLIDILPDPPTED